MQQLLRDKRVAERSVGLDASAVVTVAIMTPIYNEDIIFKKFLEGLKLATLTCSQRIMTLPTIYNRR